jgi:predicted nucleic acid-binding protein
MVHSGIETNSMKCKLFLDTNLLVYSIDSSTELKKKRDVARKLVTAHIREESGGISIHVLQEFFQVATSKIETPISIDDALEYMHCMAILHVVAPDFDMVVAAARLHQKHSLSFLDALILQAAKTAGCIQVLSEDLQDGFRLDNPSIKNPFSS